MCKFYYANRILGDLIEIFPLEQTDSILRSNFLTNHQSNSTIIMQINGKLLHRSAKRHCQCRAWMLTSIPATSLSSTIDRENRFESLDVFFVFFFFCSKQFQISIELDILLFPRWKNRFGGKWKISILGQTIWGIAL